MNTRDLLQQRKQQLIERFRVFDAEAAAELEGLLKAIDAFSPSKVSPGEFAGLDNLAAAEKYLKRVGRAPIDEIAEAVWEGGLRPPDILYSEGKITSDDEAKTWVVWRFKQAVGRHLTAAHRGRDRLRRDKNGFIVLGSVHQSM